ncbi:putative porin [Crocinitomicaceae bacterium]|nr:putative porin [Crocinitomicaceae bacterium]
MKGFVIVFMLGFSCTVFGQLEFDPDTVLFGQRTGGAIDTFDISNADLPTTFDGGRSILSQKGMSTAALYADLTSRKMQRFVNYKPLKFSALPHLGFAYSFGGQGSQYVRLDYSQAFSEQLLFNFKYDRNKVLGYLQNSDFMENNIRAQLQKIGQRYSFQLQGSFQSMDASHSGGIAADSSSQAQLESFGLEFVTTNKTDASSLTKLGNVHLKNYINFSSDTLRHYGLTSDHEYLVTYREYLENDEDLGSIYDSVYIDTLRTRDQFNWGQLRNAAGMYFSDRKNFVYLDGMLQHEYWGFQNLGSTYDTNEVSLLSSARFRWKSLKFVNRLKFNVLGGFNQWSEKVNVSFQKSKIQSRVSLLLKNAAPDPFQRRYRSNHFEYSLADISKQFSMRFSGDLQWNVRDSNLRVGLKADISSVRSTYLFDGLTWFESDQDFVFSSVSARANIRWGSVYFNPTVVYSMDSKGYLPVFQSYSRLLLKGRLFSAKRLEALLGIDASYISAFNTRVYIPTLDVMDFYSAGKGTQGMFNLHAFASFGIQEFRFFVRYENIGYFWNSKKSEVQSGYPISGTRLRVGVSWDFVN